jgi:hypothetical protein
MSARRLPPRWRAALLVLVLLASPPARLSSQATTISTAGGALRVHAPSFGFIEGEVLERLRDGRAVRLDLELAVLTGPRGGAIAERRESFTISFDLWEERFAVTARARSARAVAHVTADAAEAWCLEQLAVPIADLARLGPGTPFWLKLSSRVEDPDERTADAGFTLGSLVDALSRRARRELGHSLDAGPFRLTK